MVESTKIALVERFLGELVSGGNTALAEELLIEDFSYVTPSSVHYGRADYLLYLEQLRASWSELKIVPQKLNEDNGAVLAEVSVSAIPVKSFLGLPPTFKPFTIAASCVFRFEHDHIRSLNVSYSIAELLKR